MTDNITTCGVVATVPEGHVTDKGLQMARFRLAAAQRRYDSTSGQWQDMGTNWYTVLCFRRLAGNVTGSLSKGDRVLVTGRQRLREWEKDGAKRVSVDIEADAVGHDLTWGTSAFTRTKSTGAQSTSNPSSGDAAQAGETGGDGSTPSGPRPADAWATTPVATPG